MICPKCGKENPRGSSFCLNCGSPLEIDTTIDFENLKKGSPLQSSVQQLQSEAKRAKVFGILSLVFSCLGGILGLIFAIINITRINSVNRMNFFPDDVMEIDAYEEAKARLNSAKRMSTIALIVFAVVTVLSFVLLSVLQSYGIDIYSGLDQLLQ